MREARTPLTHNGLSDDRVEDITRAEVLATPYLFPPQGDIDGVVQKVVERLRLDLTER